MKPKIHYGFYHLNRVYYLGKLDENNWNISQTAKALLRTDEEFVLIMEELGFGYLFTQNLRVHVVSRRE